MVKKGRSHSGIPTPSKQQKQPGLATPSKQQKQQEVLDQQEQIDLLKKEIESLKGTVNELKLDYMLVNSRLEVSQHVNKILQDQLDDLQQYSRRYSVVLDNVPVKPNETTNSVEAEVKDILVNTYKVKKEHLNSEFDKAHRLGKARGDKQAIIVRFKSHSFRSNLYVKRKEYQRDRNGCKLRVALTKRRQKLLSDVRRKIDGNEKILFAFSSVNGDIKVKLRDNLNGRGFIFINSDEDIDNLLLKLDNQDAQDRLDADMNGFITSDHDSEDDDDEL